MPIGNWYYNKIKSWYPILKEIAENVPGLYEDKVYDPEMKNVIKEIEEVLGYHG